MKKLFFLYLPFLLFQCNTEPVCDCQYVVYEKEESEQYKETYRSTWDSSCENEVISEDVFTYEGEKSYSKTVIECN